MKKILYISAILLLTMFGSLILILNVFKVQTHYQLGYTLRCQDAEIFEGLVILKEKHAWDEDEIINAIHKQTNTHQSDKCTITLHDRDKIDG